MYNEKCVRCGDRNDRTINTINGPVCERCISKDNKVGPLGRNIMLGKIPKKFYSGALKQPEATTVGELIVILQELPDDLPLRHGFGAAQG